MAKIHRTDLNDPDNHNGMITHLQPDILECEVKGALRSITTNKASGGDRIPVELFQILEDDAVKALHSLCQQIRKTQQWPQDWKRSVFIPIPKNGDIKECSNYHTISLISHASKVMLKILQARLQQYVNRELPDVHAGLRKSRGTRDQTDNVHRSWEMQGNSRRTSMSASLTILKSLTVWITTNCGKFLKDSNTRPPNCLLRNQYAGQEATVRTRHGTDWFQIGKGVHQGCILSPCLFNLHTEYIMRNAGWMKHKLELRNINNLS